MIILPDSDLAMIKKILSKHLTSQPVWAFGSRVNLTSESKSKVKKYSDLDLVIISKEKVPLLTMASIKEDFSESNLPITVDILDWSELTDEFRQIILQKYEEITY
jgi:uncharacterized protein